MTENGRKPNILVVDDEDEILWFCSNVLKKMDFVVTTINSGKGAWELIQSYTGDNGKTFDAAIIDLQMNDMDGTVLIRKINELKSKDSKFSQVKIIAMSGDINMARMLQNLDTDASFEKPIGVDELQAMVKGILR